MSDGALNFFVARGSAAQRAAFVPAPPTPAAGPTPAYIWHQDDNILYGWDGAAWQQLSGGSIPLLTADPGSPANDTWWAVRTAGAPNTVTIKARIAGSTVVIASADY